MPTLATEQFCEAALPVLEQFARIPCLSPGFDAEWKSHGHLDAAAALLADWARGVGLPGATVKVRELEGCTPMLVVDVPARGSASGTVVLYGHLDKQPALGDWGDGLDPFRPVRRDDRLYARGVADDGYALFAAMLGLRALEDAATSHARCVVLIEASEESGSPDLEAHLDALGDELGRVDLLVCLDSGALSYDRLWVTTSLRGVVNLAVTVEVLRHGVHSGSAGGVVPSSFRILRLLLDRLENSRSGEILLAPLHAKIPDGHLAAAGVVARDLGDPAGAELPVVAGLRLLGRDGADRLVRHSWEPALEVIGMEGVPAPADAANLLRPSTTAVLNLRLPPTVDAVGAADLVARTLESDPPHGATVRVTAIAHGNGWVAPPLRPWLRDAVDAASREEFGHEPGFVGEGGSIPFLAALGSRFPDVQFLATGALGPNSNAHAPDESLHLPTAARICGVVASVVAAHGRAHDGGRDRT